MRFLYLVEEEKGVRVPLNEIRQCTGLGAKVIARKACEGHAFETVPVRAHVEALEWAPEVLSAELGQKRFSHARGPGEDEEPGRSAARSVCSCDHFDAEEPFDEVLDSMRLPKNACEQILPERAESSGQLTKAPRLGALLFPGSNELDRLFHRWPA